MILKVTEQNGITIVEFVDVTRFTLAPFITQILKWSNLTTLEKVLVYRHLQ